MKSHKNRFIILLFFYLIIILVGLYIYLNKIIEIENLSNISPLTFIFLAAANTLLLFPIVPVSLIGGALFGALKGSIYSIIGIIIGATILFEISRILGREFVSKFLENKSKLLHNLNHKVRDHGIKTTLLLRIFQIPFNISNLALGLSKINTKDFIIGTVLGIAPMVFIMTNFGNILKNLNLIQILLSIVLIFLLIITFISRHYYKKYNSKK